MLRLALIMVGALAAPPGASAACRWFGTQLECELRGRQVVIGTQVAAEPAYRDSFPIRAFRGDAPLTDDHAAPPLPFAIELQDFGADPRDCGSIGNETYCY